ncbi:hypothetical protein [Deinococcus sp. YIM 77859]|uniref:hypothetical protein n=1 Tax=Deinococcus sp. YIM 77859 TaxID=1540221 RepID=UPI000AB42152|nr:hypothetical protein [Deinococcus sp. YIM 77859]
MTVTAWFRRLVTALLLVLFAFPASAEPDPEDVGPAVIPQVQPGVLPESQP